MITSSGDEEEVSKSLFDTSIQIKRKNNPKWKQKQKQETIQKTNNKGKIRRCSWFCFNRSKNCWLNNTSMDDSETVDYNNNTSVRDLVPVKYEIKDEEDRPETIETRNHW